MTARLQFGLVVLMAIGCAWLGGPARAQNPRTDRPPQKQQTQAPKNSTNAGGGRANQNANRPPRSNPDVHHPTNADRAANRPPGQNQNVARPPARQPQNQPDRSFRRNEDRPPTMSSRPNAFNDRPNDRPDRAPGARQDSSRPFVDRMRDLSPRQRERVLENSRNFQGFSPEQQNRIRQQFSQWDKMSPQQQMDLRDKENTWRRMTPEQREHIKSNVLPQWRQMPRDRQQTIQQKLGVLQNMPESARNRRLNDPNFTRGMSEEDKAMLHDLSHLHVGGAPDPPGNE
jgi:hypothetical protein